VDSRALRLGTRGSALALWQADHVADRLTEAGYRPERVVFTTKGDRILDVPLAKIGDKGLFTQELDTALLDGRIDLAVHSLKDLPTTLPDCLALAAITRRADPRDAFCPHPDYAGRLDDLPEGATIATSSLRRRAQLLARRPDLRIADVRGNVPTRLRKLDESGDLTAGGWHGVILAAAGLDRLGLSERIGERLGSDQMISAVGQGALGIVARADRADVMALLDRALTHPDTRDAALAERAMMRALEGGCQVPIAAHATVDAGRLTLAGAVASLNGQVFLKTEVDGGAEHAEAIGRRAAEDLLESGAADVLAAVRNAV
jgi:hydroxymethylbilane synthase